MKSEVVLVKAADNDNDDIEGGAEDALYIPEPKTPPDSKIRKIRYLEFKKRKH